MYQIRHDAGGQVETDDWNLAVKALLTDASKVSFTMPNGDRLILWWNGTYEIRGQDHWVRDHAVSHDRVEDILPELKRDGTADMLQKLDI